MSAREVYQQTQGAVIEQWHRAQDSLSGVSLTTLEHVGIGLVCAMLIFALVWIAVKRKTPGVPDVIVQPEPKKENTGMAPRRVYMGKKQKQLLVRVMEAGFEQLRKEDRDRIKNKVKGPKPITNVQAQGIYRQVGVAFDIPCIMPVPTLTKFKGKIKARVKKLKDTASPLIPGQKPKATVEPNNLPSIGGDKGKTPAMSF